MDNSVYLTVSASRGGFGSGIITSIVLIVLFVIITLTKNPQFFKNKNNVIGSCVGLGGGLILTAVVRRLPSNMGSIVMIIFMLAVIIVVGVASSKKKPTQTHTEANKTPYNNIDKLTKLKELLDAGAITQEEFDQKKREILNL